MPLNVNIDKIKALITRVYDEWYWDSLVLGYDPPGDPDPLIDLILKEMAKEDAL